MQEKKSPSTVCAKLQRANMAEVGSGAADFLEAFKDTEMYQYHHNRSISGILALR